MQRQFAYADTVICESSSSAFTDGRRIFEYGARRDERVNVDFTAVTCQHVWDYARWCRCSTRLLQHYWTSCSTRRQPAKCLGLLCSIIIINVSYMAQIRLNAANAPHQLLHALQLMSSGMFSAVKIYDL